MTMIRTPQRGAGNLEWVKKTQRPTGTVPWYQQTQQPTHAGYNPGSRLDRNPAENMDDQKVMQRRKKRRRP